MDISSEQLNICLAVLQQIADDPALIKQDDRLKLLIAKIQRKIRRANRKTRQQCDRQLQATTGIVQHQEGFPAPSLTALLEQPDATHLHYSKPYSCYICKQRYTQIHGFYHAPLLATLLRHNSSLTALSLSVNYLGDSGFVCLSQGLQQNWR